MNKTLLEIAAELRVTHPVMPDDPAPAAEFLGRDAVALYAKEIKCSLWGRPGRLTFSLGKNDVWDRRVISEPPLKFSELCERAYADGWLNEQNPRYYKAYDAYDFPCPKPVGQLILGCPLLEDGEPPSASVRCADGVAEVRCKNGRAELDFEFANMMTRNLLVFRLHAQHTGKLTFRIYRHRDTTARNASYNCVPEDSPVPLPMKGYDYEKDASVNGLVDPPESGVYKDIVYIRQRFPAESTFPEGFEYVLAMRALPCGALSAKRGRDLGTKPYFTRGKYEKADESPVTRYFIRSGVAQHYRPVREAEGVAADIDIDPGEEWTGEVLTAVVTSVDGGDLLELARRRLADAPDAETLFAENRAFYTELYTMREQGRVFLPGGDSERDEEEVKKAFASWTLDHSGNTAADPFLYQSDNSYAYLECDHSPWHGDIHFNEAAPTPYCVAGQFDRLVIWEKLLVHLLPAAMQNAREVYEKNGACYGLSHVPCKLEGIYHSHEVWESSLEINAQNLLVPWRMYEYSGDIGYVRRIFDALYQSALFYSETVTLGDDGLYHVIPTVSAEHHGFTKGFALNRDSTSALCLIRWNLEACAEAAALLGRPVTDEMLRFLHIARNLAPYPTRVVEGKRIFTDVRDSELLDYNLTAPLYPVVLADAIHPDSEPELLETAKNTAQLVKGWHVAAARTLLGLDLGTTPEHLINSRSGDIHLFYAADTSRTVAFRGLYAKGGFRVSASLEDGAAREISVCSLAGSVCRLCLPQQPEHVRVINCVSGGEVPHRVLRPENRKERIEFSTEKGGEYEIVVE